MGSKNILETLERLLIGIYYSLSANKFIEKEPVEILCLCD